MNYAATTPLMALDAVALDTETTGVDTSRARIVEIGAIRIRAGRPAVDDAFTTRVNPGEAIPPSSTAIHGIDDAGVAGAPSFPQAWERFAAWRGDALVIGHSLGFDFAVLRHECGIAGLTWVQPRALDVRLLAEAVAPGLGGYDLERLAAWLDTPLDGRHSATGDAVSAAQIFVAMIPHLRAAGLRTLAEAERACAQLTHTHDAGHRAGWLDLPPPNPARDGIPRVDLFPYRSPVSSLMSKPVFVERRTTLAQALSRMLALKISSVLVHLTDSLSAGLAETGIVTERDVMRVLDCDGASGLSGPVSDVMSYPLHAVASDVLAYRAIGQMERLRVRHLGVVHAGEVAGILSARDLLRLRGRDAIWLGDDIDHADSPAAMAQAWGRLPQVAARLRREGLTGLEVARLISEELRALTRRAAVLAERQMLESGAGAPPCPYAVAVLGSAGRGESLLALDQDNALVFAEGAPDGPEDRWFARLGGLIADLLHEAGVPYCKGGVMAREPQWRGSVETWRARCEDWVLRSRPADLLSVDIFFDWCGVHGDAALADAVRSQGFDRAGGDAAFVKLMVEAAGPVTPALGLFGRLLTRNGRIDLKRSGLFGIVSFSTVLAIRNDIRVRRTPERIEAIRALLAVDTADLDALLVAQATFLDLILDQQIEDIEHGWPAGNAVAVRGLREADRRRLKTALGAVAHLDEMLRDLLFRH